MPWVKEIQGQDKQYTHFTDALKVCKIEQLAVVICKQLTSNIDMWLSKKPGHIDVYAFEGDNMFSLLFSHWLTQSKFSRNQKIRYFKVCRNSIPEKEIRSKALLTRKFIEDARIDAEINLSRLVILNSKAVNVS